MFSVLQEVIEKQIQTAIDTRELLEQKSEVSALTRNVFDERLERERKSLSRTEDLRDGLYQSFVEGLMSEAEYVSMKERYGMEIQTKKQQVSELERMAAEAKELTIENSSLAAVLPFENVAVQNRELLTALVERIEIRVENQVSIHLKYQDALAQLEANLKGEGGR